MPILPADFADLEPFADWALATEPERYAKRLSSSQAELEAFYNAGMPVSRMRRRTSSGCPSTTSRRMPPVSSDSATRWST